MKLTKAMIIPAAIFTCAIPIMESNDSIAKENKALNDCGYSKQAVDHTDGQQLLACGGAGRGAGTGVGKGSGNKHGSRDRSGRIGSTYGPGDGTGQHGGYGPDDGAGEGGSNPQDETGNGVKTRDCPQP